MTDLSKNILAKIKEDNVRPYSKWRFLSRRSIIWILFGLSVLFGSLATAVALFQLKTADWDLYQHFSHSPAEFLLLITPFFWLFFLLISTGVAFFYFRHTEQGYRYRTVWVIAGSIALSVMGGRLLCATTFPEKLESIFQKNVTFYKNLQERKKIVWMSPANGLLAGEISKIISTTEMQLKDLHGHTWIVVTTDAIWRGRIRPVEKIKIKLIGHMISKGRFVADEIRPWQGRGWRNKGYGSPNAEEKIEKGMLSGEISKIISAKELQLKDLQGHTWLIDTAGTIWRGQLKPVENLHIRVFGHKESKSHFIADEIRPLRKHGRRHGHQ